MASEALPRPSPDDSAKEAARSKVGEHGAPRSLMSLVERFAERGDRPALVALGGERPETWSYAHLHRTIGRLATGLLRAGLARGEAVGLLAPNGPEWVAAYFAIVAAGGLAVPVDPLMGDDDLAGVLRRSRCRRIFTTSGQAVRLRGLDVGGPLEPILFDAPREDGQAASHWRRLLAAEIEALPELRPEETASLLYTSGTTGTPKGVPLSHANFLANVEALIAAGLARPDDRVLLPLPLHHVYPFTVGLLTPLALGAAVVLPAGMSGPQILQALRGGRATIMIAVPRLLAAMLTGIEARAASRGGLGARLFRAAIRLCRWLYLRFGWRLGRRLFRRVRTEVGGDLALLACGGARLEPEVEASLDALGWEVLTGYGLTETSPILTFNPRGRARIGSAGLPVAGVELRIGPAAEGGDGEILARGPNVFAGYRDAAAATEAAFTEDGWFRTGDLGRFDRDGYLHLVGRAKEVVVLASGKNVLPEEVENAYLDSPYLKEVGVLERNGQLVALVVPDMEAVRARGAGRVETLLRDEIEAISARLPSYRRLSGYAVAQEPLPRTPIGKLRRHLLPERFAAAAEGRQAPAAAEPSEADKALLASPLGSAAWDWLEARFADRALTLDTSPQLDLGMDSLEWVGLTLEMQGRFGVELTEDAIARIVTLRDLLQEMGKAARGDAAPGPATLTPDQARWIAPPGPWLLLLGRVIYGLNRIAMRLLFRLDRQGLERLPADGPLLFTPNHASYLDPFAVAAALPWRLLRRTYWAGAAEILFTNRLKRLFSRATQVFPVDPYRGAGTSLAYATAILSRGDSLVWFPEGRRSPEGRLLPFLPGIGVIAETTGPTIVPVWIEGSFEALPSSRRWPRFGRIRVTFGPPLQPQALADQGEGRDGPGRIADALRHAVEALAAEGGAADDRRGAGRARQDEAGDDK